MTTSSSIRRQPDRPALQRRPPGASAPFFPFGALGVAALAIAVWLGLSIAPPPPSGPPAVAAVAPITAEAGPSTLPPAPTKAGPAPTAPPPASAQAAHGSGHEEGPAPAAAPHGALAVAPVVPASPPAAEPPAKTAPVADPGADLTVELSNGRLTIRAEVASPEDQEALISAARVRLSPPRIQRVLDRIEVVTKGNVVPPAPELFERCLDTLTDCYRGTAWTRNGRFGLDCLASGENQEAIQERAAAPLRTGRVGTVAVANASLVAQCEATLTGLAQAQPLRFDIGTANIAASSISALNLYAMALNECPGRYVVVARDDQLEASPLALERGQAIVDALSKRVQWPHRIEALAAQEYEAWPRPLLMGGEEPGPRGYVEIHTAAGRSGPPSSNK